MLLNTENGGETPPEKPEGANPPEAPDGTQLPAALPPDSWRQFSREVQYSFRYFSVRYDADGTQEGVNCTAVASITEEEAAAYSDTVLAGGKTSGYYAGYRFRVQSTADGTTVIFLNSERELQAVRSLLLLTIAIACGCLLGVFALVLLFSRRAIAPYLELNPEHFYCVEPHAHGRSFVTARGWEDLSETLCSYERLGFPIEEGLFGEFLQHPQIAASFGAFFRLFSACREQLDVTAVLSGASAEAAPALRALRFDGRLAAVEFLLHTLTRELAQWRADAALTQSLESFLAALQAEAEPLAAARGNLARRERAVQIRKECGALPAEEAAAERRFSACVHARLDGAQELSALTEEKNVRAAELEKRGQTIAAHLENAMRFVRETFGAGQELLVFLTQLDTLPEARRFLQRSAAYAELCGEVLPEQMTKEL